MTMRTPVRDLYRTAVYRLYDRSGQLLYIGMCADPQTRWLDHAREKAWWADVDLERSQVTWFKDREEAGVAERLAIVAEGPAHNVLGVTQPSPPPFVVELDIVGPAEIAKRLGVSRQRVQQLVSRPGFPRPAKVLAAGKIWKTEDVEGWIREHRPDLAGGDTNGAE